MDGVHPFTRRHTDAAPLAPRPPVRQAHRLGGSDLRVSRREAQPLGLDPGGESYARMLWPFFRVTTPDQVRAADVLAFAHGIGLSGRTPSSATVGARIACLSSFYRFTIRMGLLTGNPCDALERPRTVPSVARGYSADEVRRLLAIVPDTVRGRRDRAILLVLVLTGRRRAEVIDLRAGDLSLEGETVFYSYRGKGGKRGRRELPRPAYAAILRTLADAGKDLATMDPETSLWQAGADRPGSAAARSTGDSGGTWRQPASYLPGCTSCGIPRRSSVGMPARRSRRSRRSSTTLPSRLRPSTCGGSRVSRMRLGAR
jgi:integrase